MLCHVATHVLPGNDFHISLNIIQLAFEHPVSTRTVARWGLPIHLARVETRPRRVSEPCGASLSPRHVSSTSVRLPHIQRPLPLLCLYFPRRVVNPFGMIPRGASPSLWCVFQISRTPLHLLRLYFLRRDVTPFGMIPRGASLYLRCVLIPSLTGLF